MDVLTRTSISLGVAARDLSDSSRALVELAADENAAPGTLMAIAWTLRMESLRVHDRAVLAGLARGVTWAEIGEHLRLTPKQAQSRYESTYKVWAASGNTKGYLPRSGKVPATPFGSAYDADAAGTAVALDLWLARHTDPWETPSSARYEHFRIERGE